MELELPATPQTTDNSKEQYKNGPTGAQEQKPLTQKEQEKIMKDELPFLKLRKEYDELQLAIIENSVMLGVRPVNTVPGLLGAELAVREIQAKGFMANWANEMQHQMQQMQEQAATKTPGEEKSMSEEAAATQA